MRSDRFEVGVKMVELDVNVVVADANIPRRREELERHLHPQQVLSAAREAALARVEQEHVAACRILFSRLVKSCGVLPRLGACEHEAQRDTVAVGVEGANILPQPRSPSAVRLRVRLLGGAGGGLYSERYKGRLGRGGGHGAEREGRHWPREKCCARALRCFVAAARLGGYGLRGRALAVSRSTRLPCQLPAS